MREIKPRPSVIEYGTIHTGLKENINRLEVYRNNRKQWYQFWKPKYQEHLLALTDKGIYEIFPPDHKEHPPLFESLESK